jgi:kynurenine formamidase
VTGSAVTIRLSHLADGVDMTGLDHRDFVFERRCCAPTRTGRFVMIFEDVGLAALGSARPVRVLAMPLFIQGLDGSPCTVIAELRGDRS